MALFDSYDEALAACAGTNSGYQNDLLVSAVFDKTRAYAKSLCDRQPKMLELEDLRTMLGVYALKGKHATVLDFGGACGAHYHIARTLLDDEVSLCWKVVETPAMATRAQALENSELQFLSSLQSARESVEELDLAFSSGALQYVRDPYETLEELCSLGARKLFVTRVGLSIDPREYVFIQESKLSWNGPGALPHGYEDVTIRYPVTMARKDMFEGILSKNYYIDLVLAEEQNAYTVEDHSFNMYGYMCTKR